MNACIFFSTHIAAGTYRSLLPLLKVTGTSTTLKGGGGSRNAGQHSNWGENSTAIIWHKENEITLLTYA